jgi:serine/threonine protein kinase
VTALCLLFVDAGGLPLQQLLRYGGQILSALVELHNQGVVMADLKPQNLLLDDDLDELVVTDFGLSRIVSHTGDQIVTDSSK